MADKQQTTKKLGFRDDKGALVCPADVLDAKKSYTVHLTAEDGSWAPEANDLKHVGNLLGELGLTVSVAKSTGSGGTPLYNKRGVVIARFVEGQIPGPIVTPAPVKEEAEPEPDRSEATTKELPVSDDKLPINAPVMQESKPTPISEVPTKEEKVVEKEAPKAKPIVRKKRSRNK